MQACIYAEQNPYHEGIEPRNTEECLESWDIGPEREPCVVEVEDESYCIDKQDICNEPLAVHLRTGTKRKR